MRMLAAWCFFLSTALWAHADDWPRFRGSEGQGVSNETGLPIKWGPKENIAWKTPVPGEGWSSPVVWGKRVFVTSTTEAGKSCHILAFDAETGAQLWDREVLRQQPPHKRGENSHATSTPTTDGERVYAVFGEGGIAAVTVAGEPVWTYQDFKFHSHHGLSASPVLYKDLLIMTYDGSSKTNAAVGWQKPWDGALVVALDSATGKVRWKSPRGLSRLAHATPLIVNVAGRDVLASPAGEVVQGFDPQNGKLLWTVPAIGEGVTPSPAIGEGMMFTASGFGATALRAIRLEGGADNTSRQVVWDTKKGVTTIPSPIYVKPYLYMATEKGIAYCLDAATGKQIWQERLPGSYAASPVYADGRLYFLSETGETTVLEPGSAFRILAQNPLGERCQASMAVANGRFFIRTRENLYAIRKGD
ncbi:MAG: PQQ-binding-like beta-propeller repeat protein [Planctomycetota bacterium]